MKWNWKIALELCGIVLAALLKLCIPQDDLREGLYWDWQMKVAACAIET